MVFIDLEGIEMELPKLDRDTRGNLVRSWQLFLRSQGIEIDFSSNTGDGIFGVGTERGTPNMPI